MSLADDLRATMTFAVEVCKVCSLLKTLPEAESDLLKEAYAVGVPGRQLYEILKKNGHTVGRDTVIKHRNVCLVDAE